MNRRCEKILEILGDETGPVTATTLAEEMGVSRQVIVGDVALLRASGYEITATSRGYTFSGSSPEADFAYIGTVACQHDFHQMKEELYTIVDFGGTVIDVAVEHAVYGELSGVLNISSRFEVDEFMRLVQEEENSAPICSLTGGIHIHRIGCKSRENFDRINDELVKKGIALNG